MSENSLSQRLLKLLNDVRKLKVRVNKHSGKIWEALENYTIHQEWNSCESRVEILRKNMTTLHKTERQEFLDSHSQDLNELFSLMDELSVSIIAKSQHIRKFGIIGKIITSFIAVLGFLLHLFFSRRS